MVLMAMVLVPRVVAEEQAQARQIGGVGIAVFEDSNFRGRNATFRSDTPNIGRAMNDRISSLRVARGELWEACEHENYRGRCQVFSGSEPDLGRVRWNDQITSLRRVRGGGGGGGVRPPFPGPGPGPIGRIVLFDDRRFRGQSLRLGGPAPSLSGFQNRAESVQIFGGAWELCDETRYRGRCAIVTSNVSDLAALGLRNRVSSARPRQRFP
jgi:hypothetical protein